MKQAIIDKSFTSFKENFYSRVSDFEMFECADFNLLKIVLDGLKVRYTERGTGIPRRLFRPVLIFKLQLFYTRGVLFFKGNQLNKFLKSIKSLSVKDLACVDYSGSFLLDDSGFPKSFYFGKIIDTIGREKINILVGNLSQDAYPHDFIFGDQLQLLFGLPLSQNDIQLRNDLLKSYRKIEASGIFNQTELNNIQAAIHVFFDQYRGWKYILKHCRPKKIFFEQHYHREGLMLAMKRLNICSVELQHGLISPEDIFYVFPKRVKSICDRALFANYIFVYGNYWRNILEKGAEYSPDQIKVMGYTNSDSIKILSEVLEEINSFVSGRKVILITTQTFMHEYFISYAGWLAKELFSKKSDWCILIKPHPAEDKTLYSNLESNTNVKVTDAQLGWLFSITELHISIYSTTLFDAARFGVRSYALYYDVFGDYVNSIVASGVAELLMPTENVVERRSDKSVKFDPGYFYENFEKHTDELLSLIR